MKKLYISCPITGRDWKDVMKSYELMHKLACMIFDEERLEIVNPPRVAELGDVRLDDIAVHIANMHEADYFIGTEFIYGPMNRHCNIERGIADDFGIRSVKFDFDIVAPDYKAVLRRMEEQEMKTCECSNTNCVSPL